MSGVLPNPALLPGVSPATTPPAVVPARKDTGTSGASFADMLSRTSAAPQFSRHALARLQQRGITLDQTTVARVANGIDRAAGKGSRDSVIFVDGTAYVVSVRNNTVITAVDSEHMREHVFTNIDSAVIA
jgi:flagellar operon protein